MDPRCKAPDHRAMPQSMFLMESQFLASRRGKRRLGLPQKTSPAKPVRVRLFGSDGEGMDDEEVNAAMQIGPAKR
jgi:hypothetical protein